ncbi:MAG: type VI secretion system contractile sheath small subunit [Bacteroidetes bacterium]|nr:type VI secretion system contractile sheath small subunit [Bacteroidota bacterium]MBL0066426.1 type VI secretion system contractile sheath small subunit [Bacteroidota bacterium]MBL0138922.1 type VI secretion system contractile sheath small subunit [Bacteroidota bacterium]
MFNYGIGGNEIRPDASEAIADIPKNRTLVVEKLTDEAPVKPEMVYDLKNVDEVFAHFKPKVEVELEKEDGSSTNEALSFSNLGDFGTKGITNQNQFLQDLNQKQDQYMKIIKQLKSNKSLKTILENPDTKGAFVGALLALIQEIEDAK